MKLYIYIYIYIYTYDFLFIINSNYVAILNSSGDRPTDKKVSHYQDGTHYIQSYACCRYWAMLIWYLSKILNMLISSYRKYKTEP